MCVSWYSFGSADLNLSDCSFHKQCVVVFATKDFLIPSKVSGCQFKQ